FFNPAGRASRADANAALAALAGHLATEDLSRAGFLALVCGALVEQGCDPQPLAHPLTTRLQTLHEAAAALADASETKSPNRPGPPHPDRQAPGQGPAPARGVRARPPAPRADHAARGRRLASAPPLLAPCARDLRRQPAAAGRSPAPAAAGRQARRLPRSRPL